MPNPLELQQLAFAEMVSNANALSGYDAAFAEVAVRAEHAPLDALWLEYIRAERWVHAYIADTTIHLAGRQGVN